MKIEKEYPATHSMSTSWFGIDKDGNVALFDFNENGPVPQGIPEECDDSLIEFTFTSEEGYFRNLHLKDEQADIIIKTLEEIESLKDKKYLFETLILINPDKTKEFEDILIKHLINIPETKRYIPIILHRKLGLYLIDFYDWEKVNFNKLLENKFILKWKNFHIDHNEEWNEVTQKWIFEPDMYPLPFYLYQQPYSPYQLMELTYSPKFPFKASQLSKEVRSNAFHFDFSFDSKKTLQIAEYFPYGVTETIEDEGKAKNWLPVSHKHEAEIEENSFPTYFCGKTCNKCDFFSHFGYIKNFYPCQPIDKSIFLKLKFFHDNINNETYLEIWRNIATIPLIYGYPFKKFDDACGYIEDKDSRYDVSMLKRIFSNCKAHFEEIISFIKPYAIFLTEKTAQFLEYFYPISQGYITIKDFDYPLIMENEVKDKMGILKELSKLPYRGEIKNRIVAIREINKDK